MQMPDYVYDCALLKRHCTKFAVFLLLCFIILWTQGLIPTFKQSTPDPIHFSSQHTKLKSLGFCDWHPHLSFCADIFLRNVNVSESAKKFILDKKFLFNPTEFIAHKLDCHWIHSMLNLPTAPLSSLESDFPLAYVLVVHSDFNLILRLLASLFWPQNVFCLHLDTKADESLAKAIRYIANCYTNVHFLENRIKVTWGGPSILESAMRCLDNLRNSSTRWRYVQIMSESDFPLRTNAEMVQILRAFNGSLDSDLANLDAASNRYVHSRFPDDPKLVKSIPPGGVRIYKGWLASTLTREFVNFMFEDERSIRLYKWFGNTWGPEEHFWATLMYNPEFKAPGYFPGVCYDFYQNQKKTKLWVSRYQVWTGFCGGEWIRGSCRFGIDHLPLLAERKELVAHKLTLGYQPAALLCLGELLCNRTFGMNNTVKTSFDLQYYRDLPAVKFQSLANKDEFIC